MSHARKSLIYFVPLAVVCVLALLCSFSEKMAVQFPRHLQQTALAKLNEGDSLTYYQCYAAKPGAKLQWFNKDSSATKATRKTLITITEKFVLRKTSGNYHVKKFSSSLHDFPNKKFAYLKLVEKSYWGFTLEKDTMLSEKSVLKLAALELLLRPLTEYNFVVQHDNSPQLIINGKKISEQRMMEKAYFIGKEVEELRQ